jgi:enterochelin esterase family protein
MLGLMTSLMIAACGQPAATLAPTPEGSPTRPAPTATAQAVVLPATATEQPVALTTPTAAPTPVPTPGAIVRLADLVSVVARMAGAPPEAAQAQADALWQSLVTAQRVPLILGRQVFFFYKGEAQQVQWRGAFSGWTAPGLEGTRIGHTDLWTAQMVLPAASRVEYKIVLDNETWLVDPANLQTQFSGLTGENSVVVMPGFTVSDESEPRPESAPGTLVADLTIESAHLGYPVQYWVYLPAGYEQLDQLPVLYILDGNDFVDERMGALTHVLDNLIADGRIEPVMAVFVDERDPSRPEYNRREDEFLAHPNEHASFIADELVPVIDQAYRTDPAPEARLIVGVSYGGLSASYVAATQSQVFHNLAALSPSFWVLDYPEDLPNPDQTAGAELMQGPLSAVTACGGETGVACPALPLRIFLSAGVPNWDIGDLGPLAATLEAQGYPVALAAVLEGHTWSHWRGVADEMLIFFFGANQSD